MTAIADVVSTVCYAVLILILIRVAFSWVSRDLTNPVYRYSFQLTEPLLRPVRNLLPGAGTGGLDFSPMIVSFVLLMVVNFVSRLG